MAHRHMVVLQTKKKGEQNKNNNEGISRRQLSYQICYTYQVQSITFVTGRFIHVDHVHGSGSEVTLCCLRHQVDKQDAAEDRNCQATSISDKDKKLLCMPVLPGQPTS